MATVLKAERESLVIHGGIPLEGETFVAGAKNAITKMIVASLLSDKPSVFYNVPDIMEVEVTLDLCQHLGMDVDWDRESMTLRVVTRELTSTYIPQRFSGANRIPILLIGALLGRTREDIVVPTVGGCAIGKRPVNFHIEALEKLGAKIELRNMKKDGAYFAHAHDGLKGAHIQLTYPSVGATENVLLAACRARGKTVIQGAAIEPEVLDLILYLQKLGANIHIEGDRTLHIEGMRTSHPVEHHVIHDRTEAASLGMAAISTQGRVFVKGAQHCHMITFISKLRRIGGGCNIRDDGIEFFYQGPLQGGIHIETGVHPGFLTDWQQPFAAMLTQAKGCSVIHETVYENRFGYTEKLCEMGAEMTLFSECLGHSDCRFAKQNFAHSLVIHGPTPLVASSIEIPDLRAGYAYVIAALIAKGESTLTNLHFLDRGYAHIDQKLQQLGANIERTTSYT